MAQNGYLHVSQKIGPTRTKHLVHRLVARAFVPGEKIDLTVDHINTQKTDNRAVNLEWVTRSENTKRQWATGLVDIRGQKHPLAKLTDAQAVAIFGDQREKRIIASEYKISISMIYKIKQGRKPLIP